MSNDQVIGIMAASIYSSGRGNQFGEPCGFEAAVQAARAILNLQQELDDDDPNADLGEWWEFQIDLGKAVFFASRGRRSTLKKAKLDRKAWLKDLGENQKIPRSHIKHFKIVEKVVTTWESLGMPQA